MQENQELIKETRLTRRWKNIRFFIWVIIIFLIILAIFSSNTPSTVNLGFEENKAYVSLIRLDGMIGPGEDFSAKEVLPILKKAFSDKYAKGVVLDINSGGGTPVQASIIHDAIILFKQKYHKKVIVVGEDLLASGAYYVAVSADKIYVNPNTLTGSIGVVMKSFGFVDLIKKIGVERRVYTAGENKDRLDPFLPQNKEDVLKIHQVITEVHHNFNQIVLEDRKGKLRAAPDVLFSGDFWSGEGALKLGLVDNLGNLTDVLKDEFQVSSYKEYSPSQTSLKSLISQLGTTLNLALSNSDMKLWEKL